MDTVSIVFLAFCRRVTPRSILLVSFFLLFSEKLYILLQFKDIFRVLLIQNIHNFFFSFS